MFASLLLLGAAQGPPAPPNFVVVLLDDVGRDKVAAYGDHPQPAATPNLDRLAERGTLFRNAWAYSSCSPTRAALLTGRLAERTGIGSAIRAGDGVETPLGRDEFTIAAALPDHRAISLGKWHLSDSADAALHARTLGFDAFAGWDGFNQYFTWTDNVNGALQTRTGYFPLALAERAMRVVANQRDPYLLYYCPWLAHSPFHEPPAYLHPTLQGPGSSRFLHLQMVESIDTLVGRLIDQIDLDTTYVIVMGDNGSPLNTTTPPFLNERIKGSSYEGGLAVPLIVAGPGVAAGAECDRLVHVTDLFATIVELAAAPAAARRRGLDLLRPPPHRPGGSPDENAPDHLPVRLPWRLAGCRDLPRRADPALEVRGQRGRGRRAPPRSRAGPLRDRQPARREPGARCARPRRSARGGSCRTCPDGAPASGAVRRPRDPAPPGRRPR